MLNFFNNFAANLDVAFRPVFCLLGIVLALIIFHIIFMPKSKQNEKTANSLKLKPEKNIRPHTFQRLRPVMQNTASARVTTNHHDHSPSLAGGTGLASGLIAAVILEEILDDRQKSNSTSINTTPVESCQDSDQANNMNDNTCTSSQESSSYEAPLPDTTSYSDSGTCSDTSSGSSDD